MFKINPYRPGAGLMPVYIAGQRFISFKLLNAESDGCFYNHWRDCSENRNADMFFY